MEKLCENRSFKINFKTVLNVKPYNYLSQNGGEMMNYYECRNFGIKYKVFLYIDTKEYLADRIFLDHKVRVKWTRQFSHKNSPYLVIFCKVPKKDVARFKMAMSDLEKKMLIYGYTDYMDLSKSIIDEITEEGEFSGRKKRN